MTHLTYARIHKSANIRSLGHPRDLFYFTTEPFADIRACIREAIAYAKRIDETQMFYPLTIVTFSFGKIAINVAADSDPELIFDAWRRVTKPLDFVGPYPTPGFVERYAEASAS